MTATGPFWKAAASMCALALLLAAGSQQPTSSAKPARSANDVAFSPDGRSVAVADTTGNAVAILPATRRTVVSEVSVAGAWGVRWMGRRVYATESAADSVAEIDPATRRVLRRLRTGLYPRALACVPTRGWLVVGAMGSRDVTVLDVATGRARGRIRRMAEPAALAVTPDGSRLVVGDLIPAGDATRQDNAARVTIYETGTLRPLADIQLPAGSANVRGAAVSPDGRWACLAHAIGRYNLPTTQLERGWVNTNAISIVDLRGLRRYGTVLLDSTQEGAADPWDVEFSRDGATLWVSLSGVHELATVDFARLTRWMGGGLPDDHPLNRVSPEWAITTRNIWQEIKVNPNRRQDLENDLSALYVGELIERGRLPGSGPRGMSVSPDGRSLAIAQYFTGDVVFADRRGVARHATPLGSSRTATAEREGERMFHDGTLAFQHWLSCATCHPDGRADGLNWDLLNDGIGNPKNTRSLLLAHERGPMMSHGVRADLQTAATAGFRFILFRTPQRGEVENVLAYIRSLRPLASPLRMGRDRATLSPLAREGMRVFNSPKTRCRACHSGPLYTDRKLHQTDTRGPYDSDDRFLTPTLVEIWRTPPYLHDGRATSLKDVLTRFNRRDRHGVTSHLTPRQIDALIEYLLSL